MILMQSFELNGLCISQAAAHKDGGFMVSWSATGGDGTGANVYAQSFSAAGDPSGEKFQINSTTAGD